jgi:serine/threonine protein kinase
MSQNENGELHQRAKRVFFSIADKPPAEWAELLEQECGDDLELREEVESLLAHLDTDTDHLRPVLGPQSVELSPEASSEVFAKIEQELGSRLASSARGDELSRRLAELSSPRFQEGDLFAGRYRMVKRLGTGGMGDVWSARDEMLGEHVALKFIRPGVGAHDSDWIERLLAEAGLARRITHPNVCRVHDASEVEGEFFISMELVPGGDLARRLRKESRLEPQATRRLATELVDALCAIHSAGLLHRDLKPANILFDDGGAARVSDFGLAAASAEVEESDSPSGTRGYMAPELFAGSPPSEASDLYALGLVLFEAMTNRRAFRSGEEIVAAAQRGELPPTPSLLVPEVDVLLEHLVMRCLASRPEQRPTAAELQQALAQGDPLEAVMLLGDPPSAEVIASSSSRFLLTARQARIAVGVFIGLLSLTILFTAFGELDHLPRLSPDRAAELAVEVAAELGHPEVGAAEHHAWSYQKLERVHWHSGLALTLRREPPGPGWSFWYREASAPLTPEKTYTQFYLGGRTQLLDPPRDEEGMTTLVLDQDLKLVAFDTRRDIDSNVTAVAWRDVFRLAGLDLDDFEVTTPLPAIAGVAEQRLAWLSRDTTRRVEAGISSGVIVAFAVLKPTEDPPGKGGYSPALLLFNGALFTALLLFFVPRALRHFRSGLGDPWSSLRMALFCAAAVCCSWLLAADIPPTPIGAFHSATHGLLLGLGLGALLWVLYLAVEPSVQRERPWVLVAWSRFQRGQWRAPLVRGHLLLGVTLGVVSPMLYAGLGLIRGQAGDGYPTNLLLGGSHPLEWFSSVLDIPDNSILFGLELLASLTVFRFWLRSERAALLATLVIGVCVSYVAVGWTSELAVGVLVYLLGLYALTRIGLLAFVTMTFTSGLLLVFPLAPSFDTWYAGSSVFGVGVAVTLVLSTAWPLLGGD